MHVLPAVECTTIHKTVYIGMALSKKDIKSFCPESQAEWRQWLAENHRKEQSVWLIFYKKATGRPTITWSEAVDEALCFGWIDSVKKTIDNEKYKQFFSIRKPNSTWSSINKAKVKKLIANDLMTELGHKSIAIAKKNGSWTILNDVDNLIVPSDLKNEFQRQEGSEAYFLSLSKSRKKILLYWIMSAKRPETREKRILEIVTQAAVQQLPKQLR